MFFVVIRLIKATSKDVTTFVIPFRVKGTYMTCYPLTGSFRKICYKLTDK